MVTKLKKNIDHNLEAILPSVRGRYAFDAPLSPLTWFQVGGSASILYKPEDVADLQFFMQNKPTDIDCFVLGAGSNVLIRDSGYEGIIIKLGRDFSKVTIENDELVAGAAALDRTVSMFAMQHQLTGVEFLVTIPGSIGGAVAMNAGCYGVEVKDVLSWVEILDLDGNLQRLTPDDLKMTYRKSTLPPGCIIVRAGFKIAKSSAEDIQGKVLQYLQMREDSQTIKGRTGGSTFKNPDHAKAWELIDQAGCRGLKIGDAMISEKHCNFMLNTGKATANDLEHLGEMVRQKVKENTGYDLEWEIIRLGLAEEVQKEQAA